MVQGAVVVGGVWVCLVKVVYAARTGHGLRPVDEEMKGRLACGGRGVGCTGEK